jgi:hypothetical protein
VGNTDRHHENWGVIILGGPDNNAFHLAPSFDHASSLGRDQSDAQRLERLNTMDLRSSVEAYANRGRSAFFGTGTNPRTLTSREVVANLVATYPGPTKFWAAKIAALQPQQFDDIFARIVPVLISDAAVRFAVRMLAHNQRMIQEVALGQ